MSMSAVEPGARLSDRFLLEDRVHEAGGATLWKATDEVLARPVAVHTFSPDFERIDEVVRAARAASRLTDPRLTQVFDAADDGDTAYVVTEWVTGESLVDLLAEGPLEPERAAGLVAEAAERLGVRPGEDELVVKRSIDARYVNHSANRIKMRMSRKYSHAIALA